MAPLHTATLSQTVSVAGQISPMDLPGIARAGFKSVICNRPDGESPGQFSHHDLAVAARQVGLTLAYLPVVSGQIADDDVSAFAALLNQLPTPVLAYCRSGMRSATLWALSQAEAQPWAELVRRTSQAGFNLGALKPPTQISPL